MKRVLNHITVIMLVTFFCVSLFPVAAYAAEETVVTELSATGEIISDVNVRKGPGTDYEKIGTVRAGEQVTVTGESHDGWYRISFQDTEGFVYGKYMTVVESGSDAGQMQETEREESAQEQEALEETKEQSRLNGNMIRTAAIVVIIAVIVVMIILTLKSMRHDDADEDDDDSDDGDEDDDFEDDDSDDGDEDDDLEDDDSAEKEDDRGKTHGDDGKRKKPKPIVIREEDYQLHIDPKYFEDEPIAQPDYVTGYLQKKQEEEQKEKEDQENTGDIQRAMDKLKELQEEIEKLKKKRE